VNPQYPEWVFDPVNPLFAPNPPKIFPQNPHISDFSVLIFADIYSN